MTNIDPVRVAREACAREEERIGMPGDRFRDGRRDGSAAMQWAILGARAMQDAMAGREGEMDNWYESQLSAAIAELKRRAASRRGLSTITDEQLDAAMKRLRKDTPHD